MAVVFSLTRRKGTLLDRKDFEENRRICKNILMPRIMVNTSSVTILYELAFHILSISW